MSFWQTVLAGYVGAWLTLLTIGGGAAIFVFIEARVGGGFAARKYRRDKAAVERLNEDKPT
jgi:hypothetical protein